MFEKDHENKDYSNRLGLNLKITLIFSVVLILLCAFIFIYNYKNVYNQNTNGGYFSGSDGVIFKYILLAFFALLASVILKIIWKSRVFILLFIVISIGLPVLCYNVNYHSFKKDAMLYPLVSEGGALHFITIHDFNFDGVNDGYDYTGNDIRELSGTVYGEDSNDFISDLNYTIVGNGGNLDYSYCQYFNGTIKISMHKSRVTYDDIKITLTLKNSSDAENVSLYLFGSELKTTRESHNAVSVVFDADVCAEWQKNSMEELIFVPIQCVLNAAT
ncbi:MAG: hypothetical protein IJA86_08760 [Clostridia bacterium]|nr:hypothetical protein [Clostridia bacterium]